MQGKERKENDMAKRDFTQGIDPLRAAATQGTANTSDTQDIKGIKNTSDAKDEYRFSARFTPEQWKFLEEQKWHSRRSITKILQDYVEADMKKHPEYLTTIDELNG